MWPWLSHDSGFGYSCTIRENGLVGVPKTFVILFYGTCMLSCWIVSIGLVFGINSGFLRTRCTRANNSHMEKIKYLIKNVFKLFKFIKHFLISLVGITVFPEIILIEV